MVLLCRTLSREFTDDFEVCWTSAAQQQCTESKLSWLKWRLGDCDQGPAGSCRIPIQSPIELLKDWGESWETLNTKIYLKAALEDTYSLMKRFVSIYVLVSKSFDEADFTHLLKPK